MAATAHKRRILIVEDDEQFRTALKMFLASKNFDVLEATDGKNALTLWPQQPIDLILSDIRMPNMMGTDLLKHVRAASQVPFVLMTGFSDIMEVTEAYKIGASGFVTKPFKPQELLTIIESCFQEKAEGPAKQDMHSAINEKMLEYCAISINDFLGSPNLQMDIYVRLSDEKFVKIAHKGTPVSPEHIRVYKSKGVHQLYIKSDEFKAYVNFNIQVTDHLAKKNDVPMATKVKIMKHAQEVLVQNVFLTGLDKEKMNDTAAILRSTMSVLSREQQIFSLLETLNDFADHMHAHCLGVSAYSVLIAQGMGWYSAPVLFKLSMGGLLHDIGKKELSRELIDKPRHSLTPEEVKIYESHAFRGKEILSNIGGVPGDVIQIVLQHHENSYGKGPLQLKGAQIHPLAKVVGLADKFAGLVIRNPSHPLLTVHQAIEKIITDGAGEFDKACLDGLIKACDYKKTEAA